jgi:hypothetical protein
VAHVESYAVEPGTEPFLISIVVPARDASQASALGDLNTRSPDEIWPERFVMSDGDPSSQMVLFDQSPGSALSLQLDVFVQDMEERGVDLSNTDAVIRDLRDNVENYFLKSPKNLFRGYRSASFKKKDRGLSKSARKIFEDFEGKPISATVYPTNDLRPNLPFEYYLANPKQSLCFHNSMLASLILQRLGIPNNVRAGQTSELKDPWETNGHMIVILADGRILDPTWNFIKAIKPNKEHPGWIAGEEWWWKPYAHFPFLILQ